MIDFRWLFGLIANTRDTHVSEKRVSSRLFHFKNKSAAGMTTDSGSRWSSCPAKNHYRTEMTRRLFKFTLRRIGHMDHIYRPPTSILVGLVFFLRLSEEWGQFAVVSFTLIPTSPLQPSLSQTSFPPNFHFRNKVEFHSDRLIDVLQLIYGSKTRTRLCHWSYWNSFRSCMILKNPGSQQTWKVDRKGESSQGKQKNRVHWGKQYVFSQ